MSDLFSLTSPEQDHKSGFDQSAFTFPTSLTQKYRPRTLNDFAGLEKPKAIAAKLIAQPRESAWLFQGPSGTGKTSMGLLISELAPGELHHIPSQECNLANIERIRQTCQYVPRSGCRCHVVLADEIDQLTSAAQISLLSKLDATNFFPNTIFIGTTNLTDEEMKERLEPRFVSRFHVIKFSSYKMSEDATAVLERVWIAETGDTSPRPNFERLVKNANNNVREALMNLETEIMCL